MSTSASEVVRRHERSVPAAVRRRRGVHYTPPPLARRLAALAVDELGRIPRSVVDPCCGAGSFLLAVADELVARGVAAVDVPGLLHGADVDPGAVAAAREALAAWARDHDVPEAAPGAVLGVSDTLAATPEGWDRHFDLVVGNPPFLGQLSARTARSGAERARVASRFGGVGAYTDTSALFLLAAVDLLRDGGVAALVQPRSLLAARDAAPVRASLQRLAVLSALWSDDRRHFDADVLVCAPVLRRGAGDGRPATTTVHWSDSPPVTRPRPDAGASWGPLLAAATGVPDVGAAAPVGAGAEARTVAGLAEVTAGFRDEFYGLAAAAREPGEAGHRPDAPRLVTVGMIDVAALWWGRRPARLGGRRVLAPRLDRAALAAASPRVDAWVARRLRPKVLVATQTRVPEAVVDVAGDLVPVTPAISVEPHDPADLWRVAAAVLAPPVAARAAAERVGTGRGPGTVRWSAGAVRDLPLPVDGDAWERSATGWEHLPTDGPARGAAIRRLAVDGCRAHAVAPGPDLVDWWCRHAGA